MPAYDPNNIFAKIVRGELPCYKIYEDDKALAFLDIMPRASGLALDHCDVARDRARHGVLAAARDDAIEPGAVDHVERKRLEDRADPRHCRRRERDEVGIAAHEAHVLAVGDQLNDVAAQQRAAP